MNRSVNISETVFSAVSNKSHMAENFPMLLQTGIPDRGLTIHSHFLTYLSSCGQKAGYSAISEYPMSINELFNGIGEIRADSVWFDKTDLSPRIAFEFERFEKGDEKKLKQKVENLAITAALGESLELAVLVYWVRSGSMPRSMDGVVAPYGSSFRRNGIVIPKAVTPLMVIKCVMKSSGDTQDLVFGEFLRDMRNERYLSGGKH
ncbi:MAG: hypothetical protein APF84_12885 [Gracilibacter sp. BRH_c7a]|nr:MAG: hypothetical protein APF84_12885 [Gracilibacter sp. BRH_c7a]